MSVAVEFWFDPTCPLTWRTSRWARELERAGAVTIEWKVMSLGILNEGREMPEHYREGLVRAAASCVRSSRRGSRAVRTPSAGSTTPSAGGCTSTTNTSRTTS